MCSERKPDQTLPPRSFSCSFSHSHNTSELPIDRMSLQAASFDVERHVRDPLSLQVVSERVPAAPDGIAVGDIRIQTQDERRWAHLYQLKSVHTGFILQHGRQRQRKQRYLRACTAVHAYYVVAPSFDPNRGKHASALAGTIEHGNAVPQVIANEGLNMIGQIREQRGVGRNAGRHRCVSLVHGLQQNPVAIDVQRAVSAIPCNGKELGRSVTVTELAAEALGDMSALCNRKSLARRSRPPRGLIASRPDFCSSASRQAAVG